MTEGSALRLELIYLSGLWRLRRRGAGVILKFAQVRPRRVQAFQPRQAQEIAPDRLDRIIRMLKRSFDIVSMDEVCRRLQQPRAGRRFVALTFDGGTRDFADFAWPLLSAHQVPFAVYLPTSFVDGVGQMWWLALEDLIARHDRISAVIDDRQRHFETGSVIDKVHAYHYLAGWLRSLAPHDLATAVDDLCARYGTDIAALSRAAAMSWDDVAKFASDPLATIGTATVNAPVLAQCDDASARREMAMGQAVAEAALPTPPRHFAYPFGDAAAFTPRDVALAQELGYASAVTSVPGVVETGAALHALPRIGWSAMSPRALRVKMAGWT